MLNKVTTCGRKTKKVVYLHTNVLNLSVRVYMSALCMRFNRRAIEFLKILYMSCGYNVNHFVRELCARFFLLFHSLSLFHISVFESIGLASNFIMEHWSEITYVFVWAHRRWAIKLCHQFSLKKKNNASNDDNKDLQTLCSCKNFVGMSIWTSNHLKINKSLWTKKLCCISVGFFSSL